MKKKKKKNESKRKHRVPEFFPKQEEKDHSTIEQEIKLADREFF